MDKEVTEKYIAQSEKKLRYISGMIKKNGRKILNNYPITPSQFIALQWITEEDDITIGQLSKKIGLAFSTTTDLVDRMEKNKLIERARDSQDRRVVRIHALDKGKMVIKEVIKKRQQYLGDVLQTFSREQNEELNDLLHLLYEQMQIVDNRSNARQTDEQRSSD